MKKLFYIFLCVVAAGFVTSCNGDDLGPSIFDTTEQPMNKMDQWLETNIRSQYNIRVNYRWEDIESDMTYNLVPADSAKSGKLVQIIKYLWLEVYDELTGDKTFMATYVPKILQFIGSPAVNPTTHTIVLGTAESGLKITLYNVNQLDLDNIDLEQLNEMYFHTMHHEFAHILHQTKDYPTEFNLISSGKYSSSGWQNRSQKQAWSMGFVTNYASSEPREDFVEIISVYVTEPHVWEEMMAYSGTDKEIINRKFEIVKEWLNTSWNIDIDELRRIIAERTDAFEAGEFTFSTDI